MNANPAIFRDTEAGILSITIQRRHIAAGEISYRRHPLRQRMSTVLAIVLTTTLGGHPKLDTPVLMPSSFVPQRIQLAVGLGYGWHRGCHFSLFSSLFVQGVVGRIASLFQQL